MTTTFTRRNFLRTTTMASLALAVPQFPLAATGKPGSKMRMGLVTYLWGQDWDVPTLIANCIQSKIGAVELRTEHAHGVEPSISPERRKEVRRMFEDSPVKNLGPGTNQAYHYTDSARLRAEIEGTKAFIKLSHDIGGTGVKVKPNAFPKEVSREKTIEQIGKSLNEVGKYAGDMGQIIRVEVHGDETQELPAMKAIFDVADNPNVKICWNCNPQDLNGQGLEYNFNLVKHRFGDTVHVREMNLNDYPYQELMNLFVGIDYDGWILLECRTSPEDRIAAMIEQRKVWSKMVKKAQKKI
ncbi:MAG: TIM barrel protein [Bacteroidia bacterium]|nr:TIM barrel protein [Bacteroidia bacterium]